MPRPPVRSTTPSPNGHDVTSGGTSDPAARKARAAVARGRRQNTRHAVASGSAASTSGPTFVRRASANG